MPFESASVHSVIVAQHDTGDGCDVTEKTEHWVNAADGISDSNEEKLPQFGTGMRQ